MNQRTLETLVLSHPEEIIALKKEINYLSWTTLKRFISNTATTDYLNPYVSIGAATNMPSPGGNYAILWNGRPTVTSKDWGSDRAKENKNAKRVFRAYIPADRAIGSIPKKWKQVSEEDGLFKLYRIE